MSNDVQPEVAEPEVTERIEKLAEIGDQAAQEAVASSSSTENGSIASLVSNVLRNNQSIIMARAFGETEETIKDIKDLGNEIFDQNSSQYYDDGLIIIDYDDNGDTMVNGQRYSQYINNMIH